MRLLAGNKIEFASNKEKLLKLHFKKTFYGITKLELKTAVYIMVPRSLLFYIQAVVTTVLAISFIVTRNEHEAKNDNQV